MQTAARNMAKDMGHTIAADDGSSPAAGDGGEPTGLLAFAPENGGDADSEWTTVEKGGRSKTTAADRARAAGAAYARRRAAYAFLEVIESFPGARRRKNCRENCPPGGGTVMRRGDSPTQTTVR